MACGLFHHDDFMFFMQWRSYIELENSSFCHIQVLDDAFASQMQQLLGNALQEKDLEPPRSIMEVRSMLCKDAPNHKKSSYYYWKWFPRGTRTCDYNKQGNYEVNLIWHFAYRANSWFIQFCQREQATRLLSYSPICPPSRSYHSCFLSRYKIYRAFECWYYTFLQSLHFMKCGIVHSI